MIRISDIQEMISSFEQGELTVTNYFTQLKILWDELDLFRPLSTCSCASKGTCNALVNVSKYKAQDQIIKFLRGLNDNYSIVRTQILLMDPLPSLNRVYSLVTQHERQIFGDHSKTMIATSKGGYKNNATTYGRGAGYGRGSYGRGYNPKICSHCEKTRHNIDTCYKKHVFPPHFKFKNQNHDQSHTNAVFQNTDFYNNEQNHEGSNSEVEESQQLDFTPEQYQTLLALLQHTKSSDNVSNQVFVIHSNQTGNNFISSFSSWIIDSGATDHICSSLTYFTSYHQINPIYVKLPNGNQVIVNYSGSVFLNQNHVIDNVLYIPYFNFNLLSVAKLIDKLSCVLTFDSN